MGSCRWVFGVMGVAIYGCVPHEGIWCVEGGMFVCLMRALV